MKIYKSKIQIPIEWTFTNDGKTLKSSVVGEYQASITNNVLRVRTWCDPGMHRRVKSRLDGMKQGELILIKLLRGIRI